MSGVSIETTQNVSLDYTPATLGDRILEGLIDVAIVFIYVFCSMLILSNISNLFPFGTRGQVIISLLFLPVMFYSLVCEIFMNGQTFGKKVLKTRVIRLDGSRPSIGDYLLRWLFRILDIWITNGGVGIITILLSQKGQRLGDIAAGTTVVKINRRVSLADTIYTEDVINHTAVFPQAANLNDEQAGLVREVLNAYYRDKNYIAVEALYIKLKSMLHIETSMPPLEFLDTVLRDYAHLTDKLHLVSRR